MSFYKRKAIEYFKFSKGLTLKEHGILKLCIDFVFIKERPFSSYNEMKSFLGISNDIDSELLEKIFKTHFYKTKCDGFAPSIVDEKIFLKKEIKCQNELDDSKIIYKLILCDGSYFGVSENMLNKLEKIYPGFNFERSFKEMGYWLEINPQRRKTRSGILRFINNWISRSQNMGISSNIQTKNSYQEKLKAAAEEWLIVSSVLLGKSDYNTIKNNISIKVLASMGGIRNMQCSNNPERDRDFFIKIFTSLC